MTAHLIHIGLPKAGSTFLQHWFEAHPQLAYSESGIAGYRDVYAVAGEAARPAAGIRYRVTSYEGLSAPGHASGGPTVDYERDARDSVSDEQARACQALAGLFPGSTILVVTRGYRSAMYSAYSQYVLTGGCATLDEATRRPPDDYPWDYDALIAAYRARFGAEKVIVMPFELLQDNQDRFLREIGRRLAIEYMSCDRPPANVAASPAELAWYRLWNKALRHVPLPGARRLYARLRYGRRLSGLARIAQHLFPLIAAGPEHMSDSFLDGFRGKAETLRREPLYAPYLRDYLLA